MQRQWCAFDLDQCFRRNFPSATFLRHSALMLAFISAFMLRCTPTGLRRTPRRQKLLMDSNELRHSRRQQKTMGETSMGMPLERKTPGRPAAESTSSGLLKLVHKLRWAGMEEEAERLLKKLKHGQTPPEDSVVATPTETD
jgi:hypothetical protein